MNGVSEELGVMSISSQLKFQDWKCNSLPFPACWCLAFLKSLYSNMLKVK